MSASQWAGRIVPGIVIFLLLLDAFGKVAALPPVVEGTGRLGYPLRFVVVIGLIELLCTVLYAAPTTSALGAVLLTGYLGGAVASHLRVADPLMTHMLAPVYMGIVLWIGLLLKDERLRRLIRLCARSEEVAAGVVTT